MNDEKKGTKDQLDEYNFNIWKQEIYLLLKRKNLIDHIYNEKLKKTSGQNYTKEQKKNLIRVDGTVNTYYIEGTAIETIEKDTTTKDYLLNSISNKIAINLDFISSTAYEIYNTILDLNVSKPKDRIEELKNSLRNTVYNSETFKSISIFISDMNMKFNELESLGHKLECIDKLDYLYNALTKEVSDRINLLSHKKEKWEEITEHAIEEIQHLRKLDEERSKQEPVVANNSSINLKNNLKNNKSNHNNNKNNKLNYNNNYNKSNNFKRNSNSYNKNKNYKYKNIECWNCGKLGHYSEECRYRNNRSNSYNYKNKYKRNNGRHQLNNSECKCNEKDVCNNNEINNESCNNNNEKCNNSNNENNNINKNNNKKYINKK